MPVCTGLLLGITTSGSHTLKAPPGAAPAGAVESSAVTSSSATVAVSARSGLRAVAIDPLGQAALAFGAHAGHAQLDHRVVWIQAGHALTPAAPAASAPRTGSTAAQ